MTAFRTARNVARSFLIAFTAPIYAIPFAIWRRLLRWPTTRRLRYVLLLPGLYAIAAFVAVSLVSVYPTPWVRDHAYALSVWSPLHVLVHDTVLVAIYHVRFPSAQTLTALAVLYPVIGCCNAIFLGPLYALAVYVQRRWRRWPAADFAASV